MHLSIIRREFTVVGHHGVFLTRTNRLDVNFAEDVAYQGHYSRGFSKRRIGPHSVGLLAQTRLGVVVLDQLFVRNHESLQPVH